MIDKLIDLIEGNGVYIGCGEEGFVIHWSGVRYVAPNLADLVDTVHAVWVKEIEAMNHEYTDPMYS